MSSNNEKDCNVVPSCSSESTEEKTASPAQKTLAVLPNGKLRVMFKGLCVFYSDDSAATKTTVILLDARNPSGHTDQNPLLPHVPLLFVPQGMVESVSPSTIMPDKFVTDEDYVFALHKQTLEIIGNAGPAYNRNSEFSTLIPDLKKLNPAANAIDTTKILDIKDPRVVALVKIDSGIIGVPNSQSTESRRGADYTLGYFQKLNGSVTTTQVYANSVYWQLDIPPGANGLYEFTLIVGSLTLNLKLQNEKGSILPGYIFISNMPTVNDIQIKKAYRSNPDQDFALTYKVFEAPPADPYLPVIIDEPIEPQTARPLICNIGQYTV